MRMKENTNSRFTLDKTLSASHFFKLYKDFLNHFSKWQMLPYSSAEDLRGFNCHGVENGSPHMTMGIIFQCQIVSPKVWNKKVAVWDWLDIYNWHILRSPDLWTSFYLCGNETFDIQVRFDVQVSIAAPLQIKVG